MATTGPQQVYVIQHELGPVKIGIAKDPKQRLSDIQVSSPFELRLRKTTTPTNAKRVEKFLHHRFRKYHMRGEWFAIPPDQRDFDIPTHIDENGQPDVTVRVSNDRDINNEWGRLLDRFVNAMQRTKYRPPAVKRLQNTWQTFILGKIGERYDPTPDSDSPVEEVNKDTPKGDVRCGSCGHSYDRAKDACPTCGSADAADHPRR